MYHICKILKTFPLGSYWWNLEIFLFESQNKKRMAQSWCLLKNFEQCHSGKKANIKKFDTKRLQKMEWSESCSVVSDSLLPHGLWPWTSPGQNTGVDSFSLLQGIFPTQGLNPDLHSRQILGKQKMEWSEVTQSCLTLGDPMDCSLPGSSVHGIFQAIVMEWSAISFSSGSSRPRDGTQVSRIVDRRLTVCATREVVTNCWWDHCTNRISQSSLIFRINKRVR